jgi:hypothetical protein
MESLEAVVSAMKADQEKDKVVQSGKKTTFRSVKEVIEKMMNDWYKRIVWERCKICRKEYGDLPETKVCAKCCGPKEVPISKRKEQENDVAEIIGVDRAAGGLEE